MSKWTWRKQGHGVSRRELFKAGGVAGGMAVAGVGFGVQEATAAAATLTENIYTQVGVRPAINLTAAWTIYGGLLTLPSVKKAMEEASFFSVNIDELMQKVGERLASLLGSESAIVTCGAASAAGIAVAGCITGGDPEKIQRLPHLEGLKSEVIMPSSSRNEYDQAMRASGAKIINIDSEEQYRSALGPNTAMVAVLGTEPGKIPLEQMCQMAKQAKVPLMVDASAEVPSLPNAYLRRGADMVAVSGGKYLAGPQCSGLLIGRRDLIQAAWANSAPHHGLCRTNKVGKEEIMGLLAAVETFVHSRNYAQDVNTWNSWLTTIQKHLTDLPGVTTKLMPPPLPIPHPYLLLEWDPAKIPMTGDDLNQRCLAGNPRLMTLASGDGHSVRIRAGGMKPEDAPVSGVRLRQVFEEAAREKKKTPSAPSQRVDGRWMVDIHFAAGAARHEMDLRAAGNKVSGSYKSAYRETAVAGTIEGNKLRLRAELACDGFTLPYVFSGEVAGKQMSGVLDLGEHGHARWSGWQEG
ncbi:MAG TPA: aminotransferase class V-fold PLP-dependent enzyme [Bryobacteraceae bacterium]|nr:aminotransferase class V-fold PLP-dependent enzyme [Bryobacteraceae bacterium]